MNNIKILRERVMLTQTELAARLNVGQTAVSTWETGKAKPRADKLLQLAKIFGCTIDELFTEEAE